MKKMSFLLMLVLSNTSYCNPCCFDLLSVAKDVIGVFKGNTPDDKRSGSKEDPSLEITANSNSNSNVNINVNSNRNINSNGRGGRSGKSDSYGTSGGC
ncbi:MAG: hypothetical protein GKC53_00500 [Neisseriaceae bacterium]|nr:MAG: hypothetical protein GKC53_00500 [Neisseriaceae bacterium]